MRKNVLHIINSLTVGGAEMLLVNTLTPGGLQDHTNNILVYLNKHSTLPEKLDKGVKVIDLGYTSFLKLPVVLRKLKKIIKENNIDIIHSHLTPAGFYARMAAPRKIMQVHTLHTTYSDDRETRGILKWMERIFLFKHKRTSLIFLSALIRSNFLSHVNFKGPSFILANFAEDSFFIEKEIIFPNDKFNIVAVGSFRPPKNYPYLLKISGFLKNSNIHFYIYGGGGTRQVQKIIQEEGLPVTLMGQQDNISEVLQNYRLFIMTSTREGYPLTVIEAMAAKLPCFLSDIPTLKDIAGENALYFCLHDAEAVAKQVRALSVNAEFLRSIAEKGHAFALKNGIRGKYIKELLNIYNAVLSS